jgi:hypothetical protein
MRQWRYRLAAALALALASATPAPRAQSAPQPSCPRFTAMQGGYEVSAAFSVVGEHHAAIVPPKCLRAGDLLLTAFPYAQRALKAASKSGPERITSAVRQGATFVATFQGGSVVRMQALRPRE